MSLLLHQDLVDLHAHRMQAVSQTGHFFLHPARVESSLDSGNVTFLCALVQAGQSGAEPRHGSGERRNGRIEAASVYAIAFCVG